MVKLFGRGKEQEKADEEFSRGLIGAESQQPPDAFYTKEYIDSLNKSYLQVVDPRVYTILDKYPQLKSFIIAISPLNRLTNKDKTAMQLDTLDGDYLVLINKINTNEDDYENDLWGIYEALRMFMRNGNWDNIQGFKARIITEQTKIITARVEKPKNKVTPF
jgi:hypothetical protein